MKPNHLYKESSPYLLMHMNNPVDWFPWCNEAFEKAQNENKLIIISIGYAACHWCHVMEHESFSNSNIADVMNSNYISIKVDREERPDLDQIYMNAAYITTGQGGWPLNIIALPDGRPIFAGTYFRPQQWVTILDELSHVYKTDKFKVEKVADQITLGIKNIETINVASEKFVIHKKELSSIFSKWKEQMDLIWGGSTGAPKFPMPVELDFFLDKNSIEQDTTIEHYLNITLQKMAMGGIYDTLAGGFARYSVDERWFVPHFEKMLYDQGQLIEIYSKAYAKENIQLYKSVVYSTIKFITSELLDPKGIFYSSLDADSENEEGIFYIWRKHEIDTLLNEKSELYCSIYHITENGNWEDGKNILYRTDSWSEIAQQNDLTIKEIEKIHSECNTILLKNRNTRIKPALDDKLLTAWNGLAIKGLCKAYQVFEEPHFLITAEKTAIFILKYAKDDSGKLWRNLKGDTATINAFADDYAIIIDALIALYQSSFNDSWLWSAHELTEYMITHFSDNENNMFYYTSDEDNPLIARKHELADNVIPASNSIMANNLLILGKYFLKNCWIERSESMLNNMIDTIKEHPKYYANWHKLLLKFTNPTYEIIGSNNDTGKNLHTLSQKNPLAIIGISTKNTSIPLLKSKCSNVEKYFVCSNNTCREPILKIEDVMNEIKIDHI